jgi:uncharacterized protein YukE
MADEIKLNYPMAEEMVKAFKESVGQIQETVQEVLNIAGAMEEGALRGRALQRQFVPALNRLNTKFDELADDVQKAIKAMQQADQTSVDVQSN